MGVKCKGVRVQVPGGCEPALVSCQFEDLGGEGRQEARTKALAHIPSGLQRAPSGIPPDSASSIHSPVDKLPVAPPPPIFLRSSPIVHHPPPAKGTAHLAGQGQKEVESQRVKTPETPETPAALYQPLPSVFPSATQNLWFIGTRGLFLEEMFFPGSPPTLPVPDSDPTTHQ